MNSPTPVPSDQFAIGEVAVYIGPSNSGLHTRLIGEEVKDLSDFKTARKAVYEEIKQLQEALRLAENSRDNWKETAEQIAAMEIVK